LRGGLVLVTGPTGSGKTTTQAALVDFINENFARHVVTIEEPIEFVHDNKRSIITQREVPADSIRLLPA
jgi:twitching motility protein PilT